MADAANHTDRLSEELLLQARYTLHEFQCFHNAGYRIHVTNPVCEQDILTDRWPESLQDQALFIDDLKNLVTKIERLVSGCDLGEMKTIMVELFGEAPTMDAFRAFNESMGGSVQLGQSQHRPDTGSLVLPTTATGTSVAIPSGAESTPKHTFLGD